MRRALRELATIKWNGKKETYGNWKFRWCMKAEAEGFTSFLDTATFGGEEKDLKFYLKCGEGLYNALVTCLPDELLYLIQNLPAYTRAQAGITASTSSKANPNLASGSTTSKTSTNNTAQPNCNEEIKQGDEESANPLPATALSTVGAQPLTASSPTREISRYPHPSVAWKNIRKHFEPNTAVHVRQLYKKLRECKYKDDFSKYVAEIAELSSQLRDKGETLSEQSQLTTLLSGLPKEADAATAVLDNQQCTYTFAVDYLSTHFARANARAQADADDEVQVLSVRAGDAPSSKRCDGCHRPGHLKAECWTLHPELKPKYRAAAPDTRGRFCAYCTRKGHTETECRTKQRALALRAAAPQQQLASTNQIFASDVQVEREPRLRILESDDEEDVSLQIVTVELEPAEHASATPANSELTHAPQYMPSEAIVAAARTFTAIVNNNNDTIIIDSGAQMHVFSNIKFFSSLKKLTGRKIILKGYHKSAVPQRVTHVGTVRLPVSINGERKVILLDDVAFVPGAHNSLISTVCLLKSGCTCIERPPRGERPGRWQCMSDNKTIMVGTLVNKELQLDVDLGAVNAFHHAARPPADHLIAPPAADESLVCAHVATDAPLLLWHERLGHMNLQRLKLALQQQGQEVKEDANDVHDIANCEACKAGKQHRIPFPQHSNTRAKFVLVRIHSDLGGPLVVSIDGKRYYILIIDDYSRFTVVETLAAKSEACAKLKAYYNFWTQHKRLPILHLRCDNGGEYTSLELKTFLASHGVKVEYTVPYSPQQNGVSERMNRTIIECVRSNLHHAGMPATFWPDAIRDACDTFNNTPRKVNNNVAPVTLWSGDQPFIADRRVFGCTAYALVMTDSKKLDSKSRVCVNLGRDQQRKGYRLWDTTTHKVIISRDVHFDEHSFPFRKLNAVERPLPTTATQLPPSAIIPYLSSAVPAPRGGMPAPTPAPTPAPAPAMQQHPLNVSAPQQQQQQTQAQQQQQIQAQQQQQTEAQQQQQDQAQKQQQKMAQPQPQQQPAHSSVPQPQTQVHVTQQAHREPSPATATVPTATRVSSRSTKNQKLMSQYERRFINALNQHHAPTDDAEPRSYTEAMASEHAADWKKATDQEFASLCANGTFSLVQPPANQQVLTGKWVLRVKYNADGSVDKYKARFVAKGFMQRAGHDYDETFAPVAQKKSIRAQLAFAAQYGLYLHQIDVIGAFLNGELDQLEEVYMRQPEGYDDGTGRVCKLRKSIYGLKQASRTWNTAINQTIIGLGFTQLKSDPCLYVKRDRSRGELTILALYVDDMVIACHSAAACAQLVQQLAAKYPLQDRGALNWVLGWHVTVDDTGVSIDQNLYIRNLIAKYGMEHSNPVLTPAEQCSGTTTQQRQQTADAQHHDCEPTAKASQASDIDRQPSPNQHNDVDTAAYRSLVGALLHASECTHPEIAFAVGEVCRHVDAPTAEDWAAAKRILRYLHGTDQTAIKYNKPTNGQPSYHAHGYSDASWGGDIRTRRSTGGYAFFLAGAPVSWSSKLQSTVALSSAEAEYIALSDACKEALWFRALIGELGFDEQCVVLFSDSQSAIAMANNPSHHAQSKHIDIRCHKVRECVQEGQVHIEWVPTARMTADIFTKPLNRVLFASHRSQLIVLPIE
jgi:hypothetical protein